MVIYCYPHIVICMAKLNVVLPDKTEERFRRAVFESKGMKKGNISEALTEAIDLWIIEQANKKRGEKAK